VRQLILLTIVAGALIALLWVRSTSPSAADPPALVYVATAHQFGVVGYRDPAGAISPDGRHIAFAEGRFIRVLPIGGGAPIALAAGEGQIRYLVWSSNDTVVAEDVTPEARWWTYRVGAADRQPLWAGKPIETASLRQLVWSPDGKSAAALSTTKEGMQVWRIAADTGAADVQRVLGRASFPAFTTTGEIACIVDARLTIPCGGAKRIFEPDLDVYGPIAFSRRAIYFAAPNDRGMVDLWMADPSSLRAHKVSPFSRDSYAPSIAAEGTTIFKVQAYRTVLADVPASGGTTRQLTTFQSETPSFHPTNSLIAFTYGTWRRVIDDAKYPDIAQEIGVIDVMQGTPAEAPLEVIAQSDSEDQAMAWSPNGKWIAFHTHREMSDDVWLRPVDGKQPDKRITFLGRGAEVGWPRWSPDGKTVLVEGARKSDGRSVIHAIGVDQDTGNVTSDLREVRADGFDGEIGHAEWLGGNQTVIAVAKEGPGRHAIITVPAAGGVARVVHRYATEHDFSGLGVSPDGRHVVFAAPALDGRYQIFRKALDADAAAVQVTSDPSNKTQPAWSPDGQRIAFTIWSYDATFWSFTAQ
jgi:Tol biopolymer transport system component